MKFKANQIRFNAVRFVCHNLFLAVVFALLAAGVQAQTGAGNAGADLPVWQNYKGVGIGMTAAEARSKLGAPKTEDNDGLFYVLSDTETAHVLLDGEKKVRAVSVIFSAEHANPPKFADIFGKAAKAEPKSDGSIYKLIRFENAGYWVSYSRLAGDKALVTVMIQKL